jgi:hypothetical protein
LGREKPEVAGVFDAMVNGLGSVIEVEVLEKMYSLEDARGER